MVHKLPIVGVFGAGTPLDAERTRLARDVGAMVAGLGTHLLTGAGYGVMAAAAEGFISTAGRIGWSIGIVPRDPGGPFDEPSHGPAGRPYPNPFVEIAIRTPLPPRVDDWRSIPARNHINVLTADVIIALPGGLGTGNELDMAAEYRGASGLSRTQRQTVLIGPADEFDSRHRKLFIHTETIGEAEQHVRRVLAARGFALGTKAAS